MIEVGAITAASQAVTRLLRLSKVARLQAAVSRYSRLHAQLRAQKGLESPADKIADLVDLQVGKLVEREKAALARVYDWSVFAGALAVSLILGAPIYWLVIYPHWWTTALLVVDAVIIVLFMAVGIAGIRRNPEVSEPAALGPPQEQIEGSTFPPPP